MAREISAWRDDVLVFLSSAIGRTPDKIKFKANRTTADVIHEIGDFFDWQTKEYPGSLTASEQLEITAAVVTHIQEHLVQEHHVQEHHVQEQLA